jgi:hypothetical protein
VATLSTLRIVRGTNLTNLAPAAAAEAGDKFTPGADTFLHLANASESPITVTVATPGQVGGLAIADLEITVPAEGYAVQGPFPAGLFAGSDGLAALTYSEHVGLTVGVVRVAG